MKTIRQLLFLSALVLNFSLIIVSCNSGGSTSDIDGKICGVLYKPDGKRPAQGVSVVIRPRDYLEDYHFLLKRAAVDSNTIFSTYTDKNGYYEFELVPQGIYCINARDGSNNRVFIDSVVVTNEVKNTAMYDTLKPPASIQGKIPQYNDSIKVFVRVFGLDTTAEVTSDGTFTICNLPEGNMRLQFSIVRGNKISFDTINVPTKANDTITTDSFISLPEIIAQSDTLTQASAGSRCILYVNAKSKFAPLYQWYKGSVLLVSDSTGQLKFASITKADSGIYRCRVIGYWGFTESHPIRLHVMQHPDSFSFTTNGIPSIGGTVTRSRNASLYFRGDGVFVTAHASEGYRFDGWKGDTIITNRSDSLIFVLLLKNRSISAIFTKQYQLTLKDSGYGSVTPKGTIWVDSGVPTPLTAIADSGFELRSWNIISGQAIIKDSTSVTTSIQLLNDASVIGIFKVLTFQKSIILSGDNAGRTVQQTSDDGYIILGSTSTTSNGNSSETNIIKTDAAGNLLWTKTYKSNIIKSIQQTNDGGYILTGSTSTSFNDSLSDVILIKADASGNELWNKTYGSDQYDAGEYAKQTNDGGYILSGTAQDAQYVYLIRTDATGNEYWTNTFGDAQSEATNFGWFILLTNDDCYVVARYTWTGGPTSSLMKIDSAGNEIWTKTVSNVLNSIQQTSDGGYIAAGAYWSKWGGYEYLIKKLDSEGNEMWRKNASDSMEFSSCQQTIDGGYIITGSNYNQGREDYDLYLIKTDAAGNETWTRTFGGTELDQGSSVQQTRDGGYIITGVTSSSGAGGEDIYLIKTDENGGVK